jgi:hypothetical protein
MSTLELRKKLHEKIDTIDDEIILKKAYAKLNEGNEKVLTLTDEIKEGILEAQKQVLEGKLLTWEESKNKTIQWLDK